MSLSINTDKYTHTFFALILYVLWVIGFAFYNYTQEKQKLYQLVDHDLLKATQIIPLLLDKTLHHKNVNKNSLSQDKNNKNIIKLSAYTDKNNIVYIYTLILQNNKIFFTSSSVTESEPRLGDGITTFFGQYDDVDSRVFDVFENKEKKFIEYTDQGGTFRSIFVPLYAEDGSLYIAAADVAIGDINEQLQTYLYRTLVIATLFLIFAYYIYHTAVRKIKRLAESLGKRVHKQTIELTNKTDRLQLAMQASKQGWFDFNIETEEMIVSDEYPRLLGFAPMIFQSSIQSLKNSIHPDDKDAVSKIFKEIIDGKISREAEYRTKHKDGHWLWIHSIGQVIEWGQNNTPYRVVGVHVDISERKRSELVLRTLAESGSVAEEGIFQQMVQALATSQNVRYAFIAILDKTNVNQLMTLAVWADNKIIDNFIYYFSGTPCEHVINNNECFFPDEVQPLFPDASLLIQMEVTSYLGVPLRNKNGKNVGLLAILDDKPMVEDLHTQDLLGSLSVRISIELERRESDKQLNLSSRVFKAAHEGIIITDANKIIVDVNPAFSAITGYTPDDVIGQNPSMFSSGKQPHKFYHEMWDTISSKGFWQGELWNRKKNGDLYAEFLSISVSTDNDGHAQNYIGLFSDITHSKDQQASLELMTHYDVLTCLPNRSLLLDRFQQSTARNDRSNTLLAICFLDLDNFKPLNDTYGHQVGDKLLVEVAKRLKVEMRGDDTVSRLGGDEFVFLLGNLTSKTQCEALLQRLHTAISKVYTVEGHEIYINASSGFALYPKDNTDFDTLLRQADQAMYQAKQAGRNQYQFFDSQEDQSRSDQKQQLRDIKNALLQGEMHLYYQPKVNMKTGRVFGVEALIRWIHPEKGIIPPLSFLPIIESSEVEIQLGEWVINTALKQLDSWHQRGLLLEVSVNISSYHLQSSKFTAQLESILSNYPNINSKYLQLEILESSALGDLKAISSIITTGRKKLGVHIALDDFGTGYSSLTHLRNIPANTIKIDQSFVRDVLDNADDYAIIEGIIGLAGAFNREVIAEGVETIEIGMMLLVMGCEQAQGYVIAKPMPANEIFDWVNNYLPNQQWIQYGQKDSSQSDKEIEVFLLCFEQWISQLIDKINSLPKEEKDWPQTNQKKTHYAQKLSKIKQKQILNQNLLSKINEDILSFQLTANKIFNFYHESKFVLAKDELNSLTTQYKKIRHYFLSELSS